MLQGDLASLEGQVFIFLIFNCAPNLDKWIIKLPLAILKSFWEMLSSSEHGIKENMCSSHFDRLTQASLHSHRMRLVWLRLWLIYLPKDPLFPSSFIFEFMIMLSLSSSILIKIWLFLVIKPYTILWWLQPTNEKFYEWILCSKTACD